MSFTDLQDREWVLPRLTVGHVMSIKNATGIGLFDVFEKGMLWQTDDESMPVVGAVLWQLVKGQHKECTEEQFFQSFDLDVYQAAVRELETALVNFSPADRRDQVRSQAETKRKEIELTTRLTEALQAMQTARLMSTKKLIARMRQLIRLTDDQWTTMLEQLGPPPEPEPETIDGDESTRQVIDWKRWAEQMESELRSLSEIRSKSASNSPANADSTPDPGVMPTS